VSLATFDEKRPRTQGVIIDAAAVGADKQIWTDTRYFTRIDRILAISDDGIDHQVVIKITGALGDDVTLGEITIPAGAGFGILLPVDVLTLLGLNDLGLRLNMNEAILANCTVAMTGATLIQIAAHGGYLV